jgi:hypothetical protein
VLKYSRHRRRSRSRVLKFNGAVAVRSLAFLLLVVAGVAAIRWISDEGRSYAKRRLETPSHPVSLSALAGPRPQEISSRNRRLVYPYSIIPGGVRSAAELKEVAAHDPVVGGHYAGFDYNHARVEQVNEPRLVYLSYRRGNKVYWTRKQASLHLGEKLLTDGRTTARTRCANQVSVLPKAETSPEEPTIAELERPDAVASGNEEFPAPSSTLAEVDPGTSGTPSAPGSTFAPPSGFVPLPIAGGGGTGGKPPSTGGGNGCTVGNCNPPPPPPPPAPVPEPGTLILVGSGAAAIVARCGLGRKPRGQNCSLHIRY